MYKMSQSETQDLSIVLLYLIQSKVYFYHKMRLEARHSAPVLPIVCYSCYISVLKGKSVDDRSSVSNSFQSMTEARKSLDHMLEKSVLVLDFIGHQLMVNPWCVYDFFEILGASRVSKYRQDDG